MIYLAIITHNTPNSYDEYHIRFDGHTNIESAKREIDEIRKRLILDGKIPLDCYIYESDKPLYGYREYKLDEIDFNFYKVPTAEEEEMMRKVEEKYFQEIVRCQAKF